MREMKEKKYRIGGHKVEVITIEEILQKIEKSTANLRTEEQKTIMKFMLLSSEYERISAALESLPMIQEKLEKLRDDVLKEMKKSEKLYLDFKKEREEQNDRKRTDRKNSI